MLNTERFDRLIINGDYVDFWTGNVEEILNDECFWLVQKTAETKEVIWISGNHDDLIAKKTTINGIKIVDSYLLEESGKKIFFLHGHQVYPFQNMCGHEKLLAKLNSFIYKFIKIDFQKLINTGWLYNYRVKKRRRKILEMFGNIANYIVIGHTHQVGYMKLGQTELFDVGSISVTNSYAIVENGKVRIKINRPEKRSSYSILTLRKK